VESMGKVSCGDILHDRQDAFIVFFLCNLGRCSITFAELCGICRGLSLAKQHGFHHVIIESDCLHHYNDVGYSNAYHTILF